MQPTVGWKEILVVLGTIAATILCGFITYRFFNNAIKNIMERQEQDRR